MLTIVMFFLVSGFMRITANGNSGFIAGYGLYEGMIPGRIAAIGILLITTTLFIDISRSYRLRPYQIPLYFALIWRVFLVFFDRYGQAVFSLPNSGYDSNMYYRNAALYASTGEAGRGGLFSAVMGFIFKITGVSQLFGQFVICLFSICALIIGIFIFDEISENYEIKYKVIIVMGLLPNYAILSSIFLKESIVSLCIGLSAYFLVVWIKYERERDFLIAFLLTLIGAAFHSGCVATTIAYIVIRLIYSKKDRRMHFSLRNVPITIILSFVLIYLYVNYGNVLFDKMVNVNSLSDIGSTYSEGGSSYASYVGDSSTPLNMAVYAIPRMLYFLFSPFPWQWRGITDIIAFVFSSLFYLYAIVVGLKSRKIVNPRVKVYLIAFFIIALCTSFVFSWGITNSGTATRHRDKMIIIFSVLLFIGICTKYNNDEDDIEEMYI